MLVMDLKFVKLSILEFSINRKDWKGTDMDVFDFQFVVIPLALLVFGLVAGILLLSKRQEIREKRRLHSYLKGKAKQRDLLESQLGNLNQLFEKKSIDKDTYDRLKTLVRMSVGETEEQVEILSEVARE